MSNNNYGVQNTGLPYGESDSIVRDYDKLPKRIRELLANAPFCYSAVNARKYIRKVGLDQALEAGRASIARHIGKAAFETYGPDHPQAKQESDQ